MPLESHLINVTYQLVTAYISVSLSQIGSFKKLIRKQNVLQANPYEFTIFPHKQ